MKKIGLCLMMLLTLPVIAHAENHEFVECELQQGNIWNSNISTRRIYNKLLGSITPKEKFGNYDVFVRYKGGNSADLEFSFVQRNGHASGVTHRRGIQTISFLNSDYTNLYFSDESPNESDNRLFRAKCRGITMKDLLLRIANMTSPTEVIESSK
ncbi:MAG: hypothetical protein R3A11_06470 [Bdellovibrionota bacterium]